MSRGAGDARDITSRCISAYGAITSSRSRRSFSAPIPAEVRKGPKQGLRILGDREDLAFQLMESLDGNQQATATIFDEAPLDILTYNSTKVSFPFRPQGLAAADMTGGQKETLLNLIALYVGQVRTDLAEQKLAAIRDEGLDHLHLAWAGPVSKNDPHYYRIHGGNFVVEFDNRQDGANHIHSVWRDIENDFAADVLREHLRLFHVHVIGEDSTQRAQRARCCFAISLR